MFLLLILAIFPSFILWFGSNYPHLVITLKNVPQDEARDLKGIVNLVNASLMT